MSDTIHTLSTTGLTPGKQIQSWVDGLTSLCGYFDVDPLEARSLEGRIDYTTVSRLKLCQIEVSQHRIAHTIARAKAKIAELFPWCDLRSAQWRSLQTTASKLATAPTSSDLATEYEHATGLEK